jgi:TolB-like protein
MSSDDTAAVTAQPTVFLSYATQDRAAARALQAAMSSWGLEVWLDESELGGGEAWDQKIRKQIRECQFFMPLVSAQTESRLEGYFRREWRLAVERTLDMADGHLFLLPVVVDETHQATARVPEKFLAVQWLKVPGGQPTPALEALCRRIAAGQSTEPARKPAALPLPVAAARNAPPEYPAFPLQAPGQKLPYWMEVTIWAGQTVWARFRRLPKWVRMVAYVWLALALVSRCDSSPREVEVITPANVEKLKSIAQQYQGSSNKTDIAKLGAQIAKEIASDGDTPTQKDPLLAIPFVATAGDAAGEKLADSAFAMVYGRLALSRHGHVALNDQAPASVNLDAAVDLARARHATYVLFGTLQKPGPDAVLQVQIATVADKSLVWSKSYPVAGADTASIAAEVETKVPSLED